MSLDLEKVAAAKLWLIGNPPGAHASRDNHDAPRDLPYLAAALYSLVPVECNEVARAACDEQWRVYINPAWLVAASVPEVGRELAHLVWHLLADHAGRARSQEVDRSTADAWLLAADAAVWCTVTQDGVAPEGLTSPRDLEAPLGRSAEEYFLVATRGQATRALDGETKHRGVRGERPCGSAADGVARSYEYAQGPDVPGISVVAAAEIRRVVMLEYTEHRKRTRGAEPGDDVRWVLRALEPTTPWALLLSGAVRRAVAWASGRGEYTYSRPSRRASVLRGVLAPGQRRLVPSLAVVVDTSASVDDALLARALGEIDGALAGLGVAGAQVTVYSVDAALHSVATVRRARDAVLIGAGGTNLVPGIQTAGEARPRPDVIIVLTDGDTPWPTTPPPGAVVIVALLGRESSELPPTPRWAIRVECLLND